jgi:hypothetical protein
MLVVESTAKFSRVQETNPLLEVLEVGQGAVDSPRAVSVQYNRIQQDLAYVLLDFPDLEHMFHLKKHRGEIKVLGNILPLGVSVPNLTHDNLGTAHCRTCSSLQHPYRLSTHFLRPLLWLSRFPGGQDRKSESTTSLREVKAADGAVWVDEKTSIETGPTSDAIQKSKNGARIRPTTVQSTWSSQTRQ